MLDLCQMFGKYLVQIYVWLKHLETNFQICLVILAHKSVSILDFKCLGNRYTLFLKCGLMFAKCLNFNIYQIHFINICIYKSWRKRWDGWVATLDLPLNTTSATTHPAWNRVDHHLCKEVGGIDTKHSLSSSLNVCSIFDWKFSMPPSHSIIK